MRITTGVMTSDLWDWRDTDDFEESVEKYQDMLLAALEEAYPGARIEVRRQDGITGVKPFDLITHVYLDEHDDPTLVADEIEQDIEEIERGVWGSYDWLVPREEEEGEDNDD